MTKESVAFKVPEAPDLQDLAQLAHLNLIENMRQSTRWSDGGRLIDDGRLLLFATGSGAMEYNGAFRLADDLGGDELIDRADDFFLGQGRGYVVKVRDGWNDDDLNDACKRHRLFCFSDPSPEMVLRSPLAPPELASDLTISRAREEQDALDFARICSEAHSIYGTPVEDIRAIFADAPALLSCPGLVTLVVRSEGRAVAAAQTLISHGIGGVFWVSTIAEGRGRGIGEAVSRAATNLIFDQGGRAACLEASPMSESIYKRLGYDTIYRYKTYVRPST